MEQRIDTRMAGWLLMGLAALLAWDAGGADVALARLAGSAHGFPLRESWWLATLLHDAMRRASWLLAVALTAGVWWPRGPLLRLPRPRRMQLAVTVLACAFAVSALKGLSATSCPWDLTLFGGVGHYASHWSLRADGGPGHCFPAGHASSGFSFVAGYFAFRHSRPRIALAWLAGALAAGLALGLAQQLRGAHFLSHTLWSGWICLAVAWAIDGCCPAWQRKDDVTCP